MSTGGRQLEGQKTKNVEKWEPTVARRLLGGDPEGRVRGTSSPDRFPKKPEPPFLSRERGVELVGVIVGPQMN